MRVMPKLQRDLANIAAPHAGVAGPRSCRHPRERTAHRRKAMARPPMPRARHLTNPGPPTKTPQMPQICAGLRG